MKRLCFSLLTSLLLFGQASYAHEGHEHVDKAQHQGQVMVVGNYHWELVVKPDHLEVYVMDTSLKTLPVKGISGKILLQVGAQKSTLPLTAAGNFLKATYALKAKSYIAAVTLTMADKKTLSTVFRK